MISKDMQSVSGRIERILFTNSSNGYAVFHLRVRKKVIAVVGYIVSISVGQMVHVSGGWALDRTYGHQFHAQEITLIPPSTPEAIEKYLATGFIKGLGPVYAKKLVQAFGDKVLEVIENEPDRLLSIPGIGEQRVALIRQGFSEKKSIQDIVQFLHQHGISPASAMRIYKIFGPHAVGLLTKNPYQLLQKVQGIGFHSVDKIAQTLGINPESSQRIQAGFFHILKEAMGHGQCGLPVECLFEKAAKLSNLSYPQLQSCFEDLLNKQSLKEDGGVIFLKKIYEAETAVANFLWHLALQKTPWKNFVTAEAIEKKMSDAENTLHVHLSSSQRVALAKALNSKIMVLTGGPGVGKTTLINSLLHILKTEGMKVLLCAPTGRAANRLQESTQYEAKTIHRLLEFDPKGGGFKRKAADPLNCDVLIVDEVSMVDVPLMAALLSALPSRAALFLVGDKDQLPSVGPGQVLSDIIDSQTIPVVHLQEIFRQVSTSQIIVNAHRINQGLMPFGEISRKEIGDFYFVPAHGVADCLEKIKVLVSHRIPQKFGFDPLTDIQVLCPVNGGALGAQALNTHLQKTINQGVGDQIQHQDMSFRHGDRVMQGINNYDKDVYNGDMGRVTRIDRNLEELAVSFDGREVFYNFGELDELKLGYASTIHKAQGTEYNAVIIPIMKQYFHMLQRNLLYTGITRGKKLVVLVGEKQALAMAVKNQGYHQSKRWSRLQWALKNCFQGTNFHDNLGDT